MNEYVSECCGVEIDEGRCRECHEAVEGELSLCSKCYCMTRKPKGKCGKCETAMYCLLAIGIGTATGYIASQVLTLFI